MKQTLKVIFAFALNLGIRLIPFRPANVEPIMGTIMPFAKGYGPLTGAFFAFSSMVALDTIQGRVGTWTWITASVYAVIGLAAGMFFKKREASRLNFVSFAVISTLVFDAATGLTTGPLFFHQSFMAALMGQIPFTISHLVGNVLYAVLVSPVIYKYLVQNPALNLELSFSPRKQPAS